MNAIQLNAQELLKKYQAGVRITVVRPILRTSEGNYSWSGMLISQDRAPQEYGTTVNSADFQRLCALKQTHTMTREGN